MLQKPLTSMNPEQPQTATLPQQVLSPKTRLSAPLAQVPPKTLQPESSASSIPPDLSHVQVSIPEVALSSATTPSHNSFSIAPSTSTVVSSNCPPYPKTSIPPTFNRRFMLQKPPTSMNPEQPQTATLPQQVLSPKTQPLCSSSTGATRITSARIISFFDTT